MRHVGSVRHENIVLIETGERVTLDQVTAKCRETNAVVRRGDTDHFVVKFPGKDPMVYNMTALAIALANFA